MSTTALAPVGFPNVALSNFMKSYRNNAFVGDDIAPRVPVDRESHQYIIFDRSAQRLDQGTLVAPGARPQAIRWTYSKDTYACKRHALDAEIPWQVERYTLGLGFSAKQKSIQMLMDKLLLQREVEIAGIVTDSSQVTNYLDLAGTHPWDDYVNSHPIVDVDAARSVIRQSGVEANWMKISEPTYVTLRNHPDIIDRYKYRIGGPVTLVELSEVFGLPVVVASAVLIDKTNVGSWVWGANAVLGFSQPAPGMEDISCLKTFVWTAAPGGRGPGGEQYASTDGYSVLEWPDAHLSSMKDWASGGWFRDIKVTAKETIFLFKNTCTPAAFNAITAPTGQ